MNPEEGELRPQLLDRFGLSIRIEGIRNPKDRVKIIKYRNEYDENPESLSTNSKMKKKNLLKKSLKQELI